MAKKIEGYGQEATSSWSENRPTGSRATWVKATLVIGDERVFTESEVKAIMREVTHCTGSPVALIHVNEVRRIFKEHGIFLDPA
jgi:hypothetical protein